MSKIKENIARKPSYYVKQRLLNNYPAVFGLTIILLSILISILGYSIMPDRTPYADDQANQISRQPPGFKVKMLKIKKNLHVYQRNFLLAVLYGQESEYAILPIEKYRLEEKNLTLFVKVFGQGETETPYPLVDVVKDLYIGESKKLPVHEKGNYTIEGDKVTYLDIDEELHQTTKQALIAEFEANCLEYRTYYLGTDKAGRDMLSRLLFGVRISLGIGIISVFISFLVGVTLGALAGFFGGWVDNLILWFMTVVWSIPGIMLVIAISLALGKGVLVAFVAIGLTTWVEIARVVRGQIMEIKQKAFVEAARAMGMSSRRIIVIHILPNTFGPLVVILTSNFASAILTEAGLSFLGLSAQPPMPSWGIMVNEGFSVITVSDGFYLVLLPSLCIALMVLAFNLFGNGLRDAYDPRTALK